MLNSLETFYHNDVEKFLSSTEPFILDLGCGPYSIFSSQKFCKNKIIGIDTNESFISQAPQDHVSYYCMDVLDINWHSRFDLVMDSHLFHCIISDEDRDQFLEKISSSLRPDGIFAIETMISNKTMTFDEGFYYSQDKTLFKLPEKAPIRRIMSSLEIEKSVLKYFDIKVFKILTGNKFIAHENREEPLLSDPDVLRIICTKKVRQ